MRVIKLSIILIHLSITSFSQVVVKMKREGGVSTIPCKVNGLNLKFIFDTGASDVSISLTEASFMLKNEYLTEADIIGTSKYRDANGDISEGVNINLREIEIGGLKMYNVRASVVTKLKAPLLLGQSAIARLGVVQIDPVANTLTILNYSDSSLVPVPPNKRNDLGDTTTTDPVEEPKASLLDLLDDLLDEGRYTEVISESTMILKKEPFNKKALFLRAIANDYLSNFTNAIKDYQKIIEIDPNNSVAYCYRGKSKHDLSKYTEALADFNRGLQIDPDYIQGYKWRAETKVKLKNLLGAIQDYDKAIVIDPKDPDLYLAKGKVKYELKDYRGAIKNYNLALTIDEENVEVLFQRGLSKNALADFSGAMRDFDRALEINDQLPGVYAARGTIKEVLGDDESAMEDYDKALEIDPNHIRAGFYKEFLQKRMKENVWIKSSQSKDGDTWYIAKSLLSKNGSEIKIWVKEEFKSSVFYVRGKSVAYKNGHSLILMIFDCEDRRFRFIELHPYDANGKSIGIEDYTDDYEWRNVIPQSVLENVLNDVCERYN